MEGTSIVAGLKVMSDPAIKFGKWAWKRAQLLYFKRLDRKPSISEVTAVRNARSALGGSVFTAIPFRNLNSSSQFLAVARGRNDADFQLRIHLLERVGDAYLERWKSEDVWAFDRDKYARG